MPKSTKLYLKQYYESKDAAVVAMEKAGNKVNSIVKSSEKNIFDSVKNAFNDITENTENLVKIIKEDAVKFEKHAKNIGFSSIAINIPKNVDFSLSYSEINISDEMVEDKSTTRKVKHEQSGGWGWFKRKIDFFGAGWGEDELEVDEKRFSINKEKLTERWMKQVNNSFDSLKENVKQKFSDPVQEGSQQFFKQVENGFSEIETNLDKVLSDAKKDVSEKTRIQREVQRLKIKQDESASDIDDIEQETKKALNQQGQKTVEATV